MIRIISASLALSFGSFATADQGTIAGTIHANEGGSLHPLPFVNVVLKGTSTGATTDLDGNFTFHAPPGEHVLLVSSIGYEPVERTISVQPGGTVVVDLELKSLAVEMKAMEVAAVRRTDTDGAVVMDTRGSRQLVNGIGRQQIAKGQDRNAGDVVKRIPGVTLIGERFVMVRGLADRYNTVLLNDMPAPSLEADKRAFSFDVIPTGALDRVMVYKTGAPELPGDFAGGVIKIGTVNVPAENETRVHYGASVRLGTTFEPFHQDQGSPTDLLGFDNGYRALPSSFPARLNYVTDPDQLASLGRSLPNNWTAKETIARPDQRFGLLIARRMVRDNGNSYGNITSLDYSNTFSSYDANTYNYNAFDAEQQRSDTIYHYLDKENIQSSRVSLLHNWSALLGTRTKLEFRNLFNQLGESRTTLRTGKNLEEGFDVRNYAFRWQQRTIYSGQLHGSHELTPAVNKFDWTLGYSLALSKEPDLRRIRTTRNIDQSDSDEPFQTVIAPSASTQDAGRFFSDLDEQVLTGKVDYEHTIKCDKSSFELAIRGGMFIERKDRSFEARWMSYTRANIGTFDQDLLYAPLDEVFSTDNINHTTGFELEEGTNPSDRYTAANTLLAAYLGTTATFGELVTVTGGARLEQNRQELGSATYTGDKIAVDNAITSVLPSINASLNLTERALVRVAWSNTINRPEFRELAPFAFYDFSTNTVLYGNPDVRVASITNLDARWEFYPSTTELISVGVFHKQFTDPIEMFFVPGTGSGGTRNFTYGNAESAGSIGAEVELRRSLDFLFKEGWLSRFGLLFNGSLIHSTVDLGSTAVGQERERPMMGQSPTVVNAGVYYENPEAQLRYSVLYNMFGRRLYAVGTVGTPDIYEMPRHSLDITVTKGIGKRVEVKLGAQDILNQRTLLKQDSDGDGTIEAQDEQILSYRRGSYLSAGLSLRF